MFPCLYQVQGCLFIKPRTTMSTPQQPTKAPRKSGRKSKPSNAPNGQYNRAGAVSDNELAQALQAKTGQMNEDGLHNHRKSQTSHKKANGVAQRGSVSDGIQSEKARATPIKQAYAGPTFHQSPAASALPIPSFYSKSVPSFSAGQLPAQAIPEHRDEERSSETPTEITPTKRESTPLDFLFDAARQARGTPRGQSPGACSGHLSVRTGSPASKSPAPKDPDSMFPFELDGSSTPGEDGSSFATPYKERIEALRSARPTSEGSQPMDENERRAKTDALKRLLMKGAGSQALTSPDHNNPFNARAPQDSNNLAAPPPQIRHRSGPSTPSYMQTYNGAGRSDQYFPQMQHFANNDPNHHHHHAAYRVASNLRKVYGASSEPEPAELSSDSAVSPPRISTARKPSLPISPPATVPGQVFPASNSTQVPTHKARPSVQQMEDDLRRVLKLDLTSRG